MKATKEIDIYVYKYVIHHIEAQRITSSANRQLIN